MTPLLVHGGLIVHGKLCLKLESKVNLDACINLEIVEQIFVVFLWKEIKLSII
mgnify:CR=1 FL=1